MTHRVKVLVAAAFALFLLSSVFSTASPRDWSKVHYVVNDENDQLLCEFSSIVARDNLQPITMRLLAEDAQGRLFVVRFEEDEGSDVGFVSIRHLQSDSILRIDFPGDDLSNVVSFDGASFTYLDGERDSATARQNAESLLANAPADFMAGLEGVTRLGKKYASVFGLVSESLFDLLFFDDLADTELELVSVTSTPDYDFDPDVDSPNAFEQQFGSHFYE